MSEKISQPKRIYLLNMGGCICWCDHIPDDIDEEDVIGEYQVVNNKENVVIELKDLGSLISDILLVTGFPNTERRIDVYLKIKELVLKYLLEKKDE